MSKAPRPIVRKTGGTLSPVSAWDAELLDGFPANAEFDLVLRSPRSARHSSMYWAQLGLIVKATGAFATAEKMHVWIKVKLGYVAPIFGPKGEVIGMSVDSAAFDKMNQADFNVFYERAVELVAREMGIDMAEVRPGWGI